MTFIETLQAIDGAWQRPEYHLRRMYDTLHLQQSTPYPAYELPHIPRAYRKGICKCRLEYDTAIRSVSFSPYTIRKIDRLILTDGNGIRYDRKYADRSALDNLKKGCTDREEILILIDGKVTDTSYSNVLFDDGRQLYTPDSYLLNGTRRQYLLDRGWIRERRITVADIPQFHTVHLINALIAPGESVLPISAVLAR